MSLPESDQADMGFFIEQLRTILPVLDFESLRSPAIASAEADTERPALTTESLLFVFTMPSKGIAASAREQDG